MGSTKPTEQDPDERGNVLVSHFLVDPARAPHWIAACWQGEVPDSLTIHTWVVMHNPWRVLLVWDAADDKAWETVQGWFAPYGTFETERGEHTAISMAAHGIDGDPLLRRDAEAFGEWLKSRGAADDVVAQQVALRRDAANAPTREAALAIADAFGTWETFTIKD